MHRLDLSDANLGRIRDGLAVLITSDERELVIPIGQMPDWIEGGQSIRFDEANGEVVNIELDEEAQAETSSRISSKMERLRERGRKNRK